MANGDDVVSIFGYLYDLGYKDMLLFDNFGNIMLKIRSDEYDKLEMLAQYTLNAKPTIVYYYDVCLVHEDSTIMIDDIIAFIADEER